MFLTATKVCKHRKNSLEQRLEFLWEAMSEPHCEWSKGGAKTAFYFKKRFAATCGVERNVMKWNATKVGYLTAVGNQ